ncbi:MAG: OmpA family protein [candidate division Zixibacteria bacterium]|nr:OmpA family protein [candidate division Zixibacteria bacterium]
MSDDENKRPIIIINKKVSHAGHHGGAWKVAFADFVTALMAFFLVMWLVNQSVVVKEAVAGYFQDPSGYMKKLRDGGSSVNQGGQSVVKLFKYDKANLKEKLMRQQKILAGVSVDLKKSIEELPNIGNAKDFIEYKVTSEGLMIQLIDASTAVDSAIFFDKGSARLKPMASLILAAIATELAKLPSNIVIEGHTDITPIRGRKNYSNWELSADRANSARRLLETSGIRPGQIVSVRGFAAQKLKVIDNPEDPGNRRVTIIVLNEEFQKHLKDISIET